MLSLERQPLRPKEVEDQGVQNLVNVLRRLGFQTHGSCHGHWTRIEKKPWVTLYDFSYDVSDLIEKVWKFDETSKIVWGICAYSAAAYSLEPPRESATPEELKEMQESANELAQFLEDNYLTKN